MITPMARVFRGVGYQEPPARRPYTQPENELQERFVEWMEGLLREGDYNPDAVVSFRTNN